MAFSVVGCSWARLTSALWRLDLRELYVCTNRLIDTIVRKAIFECNYAHEWLIANELRKIGAPCPLIATHPSPAPPQ